MLWNLSFEQLVLSFIFVACAAFIGAYIVDKILGYAGFSVMGNWVLLLVGAYVGMYTYNKYGYSLGADAIRTIILVAVSSFSMLLAVLGFKLMTRS
ncbi:MAG: hypothetical protein AB8B49_08360 [Nitratireductor sp.]